MLTTFALILIMLYFYGIIYSRLTSIKLPVAGGGGGSTSVYLMKKDEKGIALSDFTEWINFTFSILHLCPIVSNSRGSTCQSDTPYGVMSAPTSAPWWEGGGMQIKLPSALGTGEACPSTVLVSSPVSCTEEELLRMYNFSGECERQYVTNQSKRPWTKQLYWYLAIKYLFCTSKNIYACIQKYFYFHVCFLCWR